MGYLYEIHSVLIHLLNMLNLWVTNEILELLTN